MRPEALFLLAASAWGRRLALLGQCRALTRQSGAGQRCIEAAKSGALRLLVAGLCTRWAFCDRVQRTASGGIGGLPLMEAKRDLLASCGGSFAQASRGGQRDMLAVDSLRLAKAIPYLALIGIRLSLLPPPFHDKQIAALVCCRRGLALSRLRSVAFRWPWLGTESVSTSGQIKRPLHPCPQHQHQHQHSCQSSRSFKRDGRSPLPLNHFCDLRPAVPPRLNQTGVSK